MTLQKQAILVLPFLVMTSMNSQSSSTPASQKLTYHAVPASNKVRLPYFSQLIVRFSDSTHLAKTNPVLSKPEVSLNKNVKKFVETFIQKEQKDLRKIGDRSKTIFPIMEEIFTAYNLPTELKYLAAVESELKAKAHSHAGAIGYWQLMNETAAELGLKISGKTDERKHLRKSTMAAAKYLKSLYKTYEDWLLVIAAYNTGPGVVNKAIKKVGSRQYWRLQAYLPAETRGHVKRYIAIHYFFENGGSETTLTKGERLAFQNAVRLFNENQNAQMKLRDSTNTIKLMDTLTHSK